MSFVSDTAATRHIKGKSAVYAFRDFGVASSAPPLVLLTRFRATMDHWDPAFLEVLAAERRVILFDNAGVSESTGEVATTFAGMAETAVDFITALGLKEIDLLGWSIGGFIGQMVALNHPGVSSAPTRPRQWSWRRAGFSCHGPEGTRDDDCPDQHRRSLPLSFLRSR